MYPRQTAPDPTGPTPQPLKLHQSAPLKPPATSALNPVRTGQGPQNEVKGTLEGESRTNVPRTDGSGLDPEGTTSDVQPWIALPLSSLLSHSERAAGAGAKGEGLRQA